MRFQTKLIGLGLSVLCVCVVLATAESGSGADKGAAAVTQVGEPRVQTLKGFTYLYTSEKTDFDHLAERITALIPVAAKAAEGKIMGPPILIYHGVKGDDRKVPFTLDVGFMVAPDTKAAAANFQVKTLEPFKCVSLLYTGAETAIGAAYEPLTGRVTKEGLQRTDDSRQMFLYWEGSDSVNNVTLVAEGVK